MKYFTSQKLYRFYSHSNHLECIFSHIIKNFRATFQGCLIIFMNSLMIEYNKNGIKSLTWFSDTTAAYKNNLRTWLSKIFYHSNHQKIFFYKFFACQKKYLFTNNCYFDLWQIRFFSSQAFACHWIYLIFFCLLILYFYF